MVIVTSIWSSFSAVWILLNWMCAGPRRSIIMIAGSMEGCGPHNWCSLLWGRRADFISRTGAVCRWVLKLTVWITSLMLHGWSQHKELVWWLSFKVHMSLGASAVHVQSWSPQPAATSLLLALSSCLTGPGTWMLMSCSLYATRCDARGLAQCNQLIEPVGWYKCCFLGFELETLMWDWFPCVQVLQPNGTCS